MLTLQEIVIAGCCGDAAESRNENPWPEKEKIKKRWFNRLDSAAAEVNPVLLVLAIGLAVLDFTCLFAIEIRDALPAVRRVSAEPSPAAKPSIPVDQSVAARVPAKPAPPAAGP